MIKKGGSAIYPDQLYYNPSVWKSVFGGSCEGKDGVAELNHWQNAGFVERVVSKWVGLPKMGWIPGFPSLAKIFCRQASSGGFGTQPEKRG